MTHTFPFRGTCTALVTPFSADGTVDYGALKRLLDIQCNAGVDAIGLLGTTGEDATIRPDERDQIVDVALSHVNGRVPVMVGVGTASTSESGSYARRAAQAGAKALMIVTPYYSRPTVEGLRAHLSAIAHAGDTPLMLYHVPRRTGSAVPAQAILRLAQEIPTLLALKESSADLTHIADVLAGRKSNFAVFSGDEESTLPILLMGGEGLVSVLSNVAPAGITHLVNSGLNDQWKAARAEHFRLLPAMRACFAITNPLPIKAMLADRNLIGPTMRLPLVPLGGEHPEVLAAIRSVCEV